MSIQNRRFDGAGCTVLDFWEWAYGDLHQHSIRSVLIEFIVYRALGLQTHSSTRVPFDRVDLRWPDPRWGEGRIEIKSASAVVSWADGPKPAANPRNPTFRIAPTNVGPDGEIGRVADVFLFCVWPHVDPARLPLEADAWQFYGVPTHLLNARGWQKTISLNVVKRLAVRACSYEELRTHVADLLLAERAAEGDEE